MKMFNTALPEDTPELMRFTIQGLHVIDNVLATIDVKDDAVELVQHSRKLITAMVSTFLEPLTEYLEGVSKTASFGSAPGGPGPGAGEPGSKAILFDSGAVVTSGYTVGTEEDMKVRIVDIDERMSSIHIPKHVADLIELNKDKLKSYVLDVVTAGLNQDKYPEVSSHAICCISSILHITKPEAEMLLNFFAYQWFTSDN